MLARYAGAGSASLSQMQQTAAKSSNEIRDRMKDVTCKQSYPEL